MKQYILLISDIVMSIGMNIGRKYRTANELRAYITFIAVLRDTAEYDLKAAEKKKAASNG